MFLILKGFEEVNAWGCDCTLSKTCSRGSNIYFFKGKSSFSHWKPYNETSESQSSLTFFQQNTKVITITCCKKMWCFCQTFCQHSRRFLLDLLLCFSRDSKFSKFLL